MEKPVRDGVGNPMNFESSTEIDYSYGLLGSLLDFELTMNT